MSAVVKSSAREARERAGRIRVGMVQYLHTLADVAAAYAARDWMALGYESWESYVDGEYGAERLRLTPEHRQKAVAELRLSGMSQRAIGTALGISKNTVAADLSLGGTPDEIQGADGKKYAATRPAPTETAAEVEVTPSADGTETDSDARPEALVTPVARVADGESVPAPTAAAADNPPAAVGVTPGSPTTSAEGTGVVGADWRAQFRYEVACVHEFLSKYPPADLRAAAGNDEWVELFDLIHQFDAWAREVRGTDQ